MSVAGKNDSSVVSLHLQGKFFVDEDKNSGLIWSLANSSSVLYTVVSVVNECRGDTFFKERVTGQLVYFDNCKRGKQIFCKNVSSPPAMSYGKVCIVPNWLRFILPISSRVAILLASFTIILLFALMALVCMPRNMSEKSKDVL